MYLRRYKNEDLPELITLFKETVRSVNAKDYLYEHLYCERCLAEKHNQEFKAQAFGARASSSRFLTNSYRMLLSAFCQLAFRLLRNQLFRKNTHWNQSTLNAFRHAFICAPAVIEQLKTKVKISLNVQVLGYDAIASFWQLKT